MYQSRFYCMKSPSGRPPLSGRGTACSGCSPDSRHRRALKVRPARRRRHPQGVPWFIIHDTVWHWQLYAIYRLPRAMEYYVDKLRSTLPTEYPTARFVNLRQV